MNCNKGQSVHSPEQLLPPKTERETPKSAPRWAAFTFTLSQETKEPGRANNSCTNRSSPGESRPRNAGMDLQQSRCTGAGKSEHTMWGELPEQPKHRELGPRWISEYSIIETQMQLQGAFAGCWTPGFIYSAGLCSLKCSPGLCPVPVPLWKSRIALPGTTQKGTFCKLETFHNFLFLWDLRQVEQQLNNSWLTGI